jgi:hypothetical protein
LGNEVPRAPLVVLKTKRDKVFLKNFFIKKTATT